MSLNYLCNVFRFKSTRGLSDQNCTWSHCYWTNGVNPYNPILSSVLLRMFLDKDSFSQPPHSVFVAITLGCLFAKIALPYCYMYCVPFPPHRLSVGCHLHVVFCQYSLFCTKCAISQRLTSSCLRVREEETGSALCTGRQDWVHV